MAASISTDVVTQQAGRPVLIIIGGFQGGLSPESVSIAVSGPSTGGTRVLTYITVGLFGDANYGWTIPSTYANGTYTLSATGQSSHLVATTTISVIAGTGGGTPGGSILSATFQPSTPTTVNQSFYITGSFKNTGTVGSKYYLRAIYLNTSNSIVTSKDSIDYTAGALGTSTDTVNWQIGSAASPMFASQSGSIHIELRDRISGITYDFVDRSITVTGGGGGGGNLPSVNIVGWQLPTAPIVQNQSFVVVVFVQEAHLGTANYRLGYELDGVRKIDPTVRLVVLGTGTNITIPGIQTTGNHSLKIVCETSQNGVWVATSSTAVATINVQSATTTDTVLPNVAIITPTGGQTLTTGTINVTGTASDNVALQKVEVALDGGGYNIATGTTNWSFPITGLTAGSHTVNAKATDTSGNTRTTSVTFSVTSIGGGGGGIDPTWIAIGVGVIAIGALAYVTLSGGGQAIAPRAR